MLPDVLIVGAGCFGAWTAWHLRRAGLKVTLCDSYGPANARASSGGESRIIRSGYGPREIYTDWTMRSIPQWRALADRIDPGLFVQCGALFLAPGEGGFAAATEAAFAKYHVPYERLFAPELRRRYPHFQFADHEFALYEPQAGGALARRSIQSLVRLMISEGVIYEPRAVTSADAARAGHTVYACGPWLPKVFPDLLGRRILPTKQEVLFFGPPPEHVATLGPQHTPCWMDVATGMYGFPDLESRGFKVANDNRGPQVDPDTQERTVSDDAVAHARRYLSWRVPILANAPLVETRVCQYENTANGDYLIDRHPDLRNTWIAGGGSGHGFKHGPAVGEYLADLILGTGEPEPRFSLASKPEFAEAGALSSM
ncbi:MAG: FAD-dependent oxidoreductase [Bryobacterales bacterium]|nr:FAD-dependent oxidoreductase [Bryobacterales bacterium]